MWLPLVGLVLYLMVSHAASAKPDAVGDDIPRFLNVSEVPKDDHVIHNRVTFDCQAADGSDPAAPKEIDCVMVQQDLQEPSPLPSKEEWDKQFAEMSEDEATKEAIKVCQELDQLTKDEPRQNGHRTKDELRQEAEYREKLATPCRKKDHAAIVAVLSDMLRKQAERESQTCKMTTIPRRLTFAHVKKGVWVHLPDAYRLCKNVKVTGTLRRDAHNPDEWNYTEVTVAAPSKTSFCHAETGTVEFTWRKAFTPQELKCRYLEM